jgi:PAS domain S-box-containing protein
VEHRAEVWTVRLEARLRLAAIVQSSDDAIIGKDLHGIITDWNNGAKRLYGYSAREVIGKPVSILMPPERTDDFVEIMTKIRDGEFIRHFETRRQKKDGTSIEVSLAVSPIFDAHRRIVGISTIARDISERKRAEEQLHQKETELSEAQRLAGLGSWYLDVQSGKVIWSEELCRIAGLDPTSPAPSYKETPRVLTAESWERLDRAVEEALRNGTSYERDLEMVRPDGTTKWVRARGEPVNDATGRIVRLRDKCSRSSID